MQIYLVGGAVRDALLGREVTEKDWVVVGSTPEEMVAKGFLPIGEAFPVFLHPSTKEEYALARTEKKVAKGYKGFQFQASPEVTLEEDLKRRDFTINAIAQKADGTLIDPFQGQEDLKNKLLRHVSSAFLEDPVRILRAARFLARFSDRGFQISPETQSYMQEMVNTGEVDALVAERVWQEMDKALAEKEPEQFFKVLESIGAFPRVFSPLLSQDLKTLTAMKMQSSDPVKRFSAWLYGCTQDPLVVKKVCRNLRAPKRYQAQSLAVSKYLKKYAALSVDDGPAQLEILEALDAFRRPELLQDFLGIAQAVAHTTQEKSQALLGVFEVAKTVDVAALLKENPETPPKQVVQQARLLGIAKHLAR